MTDAREQAIRELAYAIWEKDGRPENRQLSHWLQAEAELDAEQIIGVTDNGKLVKARRRLAAQAA